MKIKTTTNERILMEGSAALIKRLGYANAARFISLLGGEGNLLKKIRKKRESESIEEVVKRIKRSKAIP